MLSNIIPKLFPLLFCGVLATKTYDRAILQKKYPGFGTKFIPMIDEDNGETILGYFDQPNDNSRMGFTKNPEEVVSFTLYTRGKPDGINITSPDVLKSEFDPTKPTKLITHGWMSKGSSVTCLSIKNGFLSKYDANVFIMDWGAISNNVFYPIVMKATTDVANYYGKFLNSVVDLGGNPREFHLVGHSLGAHVSAFASRDVRGKIGRLTGLDPALPGFNNFELVPDGRLTKNDALFVDVIHTCAGFLGIRDSIGHADFYPNGGSPPQPGCGDLIKITEACSHGRSWKYFAESLNSSNPPFLANHCNSFEDFIRGKHCKEVGIPMGDSVPVTARGDYFLVTESEAPYAIGSNKIEDVWYDSIEEE